jgi:hypothetical protein
MKIFGKLGSSRSSFEERLYDFYWMVKMVSLDNVIHFSQIKGRNYRHETRYFFNILTNNTPQKRMNTCPRTDGLVRSKGMFILEKSGC